MKEIKTIFLQKNEFHYQGNSKVKGLSGDPLIWRLQNDVMHQIYFRFLENLFPGKFRKAKQTITKI